MAFPAPSAKNALHIMKRFLHSNWYVHTIDRVIPGGISALSFATIAGNVEFVEKLLTNGASVDSVSNGTKCPALHEAIQTGDVDVLQLLLQYNASQLVVDGDGMTALHKAAKLGSSRIISILLKAPKAREALQCVDRKGRSPLEVASGSYSCAKIYEAMVYHRLIKTTAAEISNGGLNV